MLEQGYKGVDKYSTATLVVVVSCTALCASAPSRGHDLGWTFSSQTPIRFCRFGAVFNVVLVLWSTLQVVGMPNRHKAKRDGTTACERISGRLYQENDKYDCEPVVHGDDVAADGHSLSKPLPVYGPGRDRKNTRLERISARSEVGIDWHAYDEQSNTVSQCQKLIGAKPSTVLGSMCKLAVGACAISVGKRILIVLRSDMRCVTDGHDEPD